MLTIVLIQVSRKEKELECIKKAPAEAESRKVMILAEAQRTKTLALAGAEAAAIKVGPPTVTVAHLFTLYLLSMDFMSIKYMQDLNDYCLKINITQN